jgi:hypothetical protein
MGLGFAMHMKNSTILLAMCDSVLNPLSNLNHNSTRAIKFWETLLKTKNGQVFKRFSPITMKRYWNAISDHSMGIWRYAKIVDLIHENWFAVNNNKLKRVIIAIKNHFVNGENLFD